MKNLKVDSGPYNDGYYHFSNDLDRYPEATIYLVWSMRGPGKTYSFLRYCYENKRKFVYMKRTNDDVDFICKTDNGLTDFDPSPFVPLNRDFGWNVKPKSIEKGVGAFYNTNEEGDPSGAPVGYILSLNKVKSIKGIDLSDADFICLDEFIPQAHEIVRRTEGAALLDVYMTVARDREYRGREPLKLVLFANSEQIATPITSMLEVIDDMAELTYSDRCYTYLEDRGIMLHHIKPEEVPAARKNMEGGIFKAMGNTAWGRKAFFGDFANNDFSNVMKLNTKKMICLYKVKYKNNTYYIYLHPDTGMHYMTFARSNKYIEEYDLNKENDQKRFWIEHGQELRIECMENNFKFLKYSMYDLIINFKAIFKV